jgi:hypothetical protein
MKDLMIRTTIGVIFLFLLASTGYAYDFGGNITIWDGVGSGSGWYGGPHEDQEVEPGNLATQAWDLEGFYLKGATLTMVGGFDFVNGVADPYYASHPSGRLERYLSGDIFIDINGDAKYGAGTGTGVGGNAAVSNSFGYDFVLDLDFSTLSYKVYELTNDSKVELAWFSQNADGNSFLDDGKITTGSFFDGGQHYFASVDLSFLKPGTVFTSHFTMQCGNDNLMGSGTAPVPEPATMLLFGCGLIGLAGFGRRKLIKG